jgi:single-strand DNA-binding protein
MRDFNEVKLMGNVATDLTHKTTPWGTPEYHCRLAVDNSYKNPKTGEYVNRTSFINVKLLLSNSPVDAAIMEKIKKGSKLFVAGKLNQREYNNKAGDKQIWTEVEARQFEMMAVHKYENATDQGQLEQQRRQENTQQETTFVTNGEPGRWKEVPVETSSMKDIVNSDKTTDEKVEELENAMAKDAPKGGVGDLDDEIPF